MKTMKRILGVFLSAILMLAGGMSVAAAESTQQTYSIKINNAKTGHTYEAYQVFAGRLETVNDKKVLSDIQWGEGVEGTTLLTELQNVLSFKDCGSAAEVAKKVEEFEPYSPEAKDFAKIVGKHLTTTNYSSPGSSNGTYTITVSKPGYYLIKDQKSSLNNTVGEAYTDFIMQVVGDVMVQPKGDVPTVEKKVLENFNNNWEDAADYNIGETVSFKLTGTLPSNLSSYKTYSYTFHDTLSQGLTLKEESINVKMDDKDVTNQFKITTNNIFDGCTFEVSCLNIKDIVNITEKSKIVVEYKATLNKNAVIANLGNPNEVYLEFSNNPNGEGMGKTPTDKVVVFTYELVVNKKDENSQALNGATFTLYREVNGGWNPVNTISGTNTNVFKFTGLDAGKYKLEETKAPKGYNTIEPIEFKIVPTYKKTALDSLVIKDNANKGISGEGQAFTVHVQTSESAPNIVTDVINKKGAVLPETGGIGTKIFYVTGCVLMIGAAIVLFRKMSRKDK